MATKKLATYRAKRDFSKTREPSGRERVKAAATNKCLARSNKSRTGREATKRVNSANQGWRSTQGAVHCR